VIFRKKLNVDELRKTGDVSDVVSEYALSQLDPGVRREFTVETSDTNTDATSADPALIQHSRESD
jgi:hypothetical protein